MTPLDPTLLAAAVVTMALMVSAGLSRQRLSLRERRCAVCHHPATRCTCHWL